jgi:hypothetical protein
MNRLGRKALAFRPGLARDVLVPRTDAVPEVPVETLAWHVVLRLVSREVISPSVPARRRLATAAIEICAPRGLLAFRGSDTHVHLLLEASRAGAGRTAQALACALSYRLGLERRFSAATLTPVETHIHLERAFDYILRQDVHHGFTGDPWHDASILPDLLGMRTTGAAAAAAALERLLRISHAHLVSRLGVERLDPGDDPDLVAESAAAAAGLAALGEATEAGRAARRAALEVLARTVGLGDAAARLGIHRVTAYRMRQSAACPELVRAIRLQVGFRAALARMMHPDVPDPTGSPGCNIPGREMLHPDRGGPLRVAPVQQTGVEDDAPG